MPVEAKPLFRADALRPLLQGFQLPDDIDGKKAIVQKWATLFASAKADQFREQELLADFISDIFCGVLGYERPADNPNRYTRAREKYLEVDGKFADAVLGVFGDDKNDKPIVAVEGKGPLDPLDRPFAGRKKSAVEQGYGYAINLPCDWIIVTSMRQTRLYHKGSDQQTYERFDIEDLASNENVLRKFIYLLHAQRVVPLKGKCHFDVLKAESEKVGKTLTKKFYLDYANIRQDVFEHLCQENPNQSRHSILAATQKLLDRVLFTAFCEDRGLLPKETLKHAFEHSDPYNPRPIWSNFRGLFQAIDKGNPNLNIPPYNGGLFADDPFLESLTIPDEVCSHFNYLGQYEYRPANDINAADEPAAEQAGLIDVEILGHIFEQSITDLEQIRNELDGLVKPVGKEKHKTRRKKEGAFYTPEFITRYIVEQSLGPVLDERFESLRTKLAKTASGTAKSALADPKVYDLNSLNKPQRDTLIGFWEQWQEELSTIRILDPACGSGAFLIEAFDQLHAAYQHSNDRLEELRGQRTLFDLDRRILQHNLFGVDLNAEAVQICRLSLWIKTAERGKTLTALDHTIQVGNSVVDDATVHPKAFDWKSAFPEVLDAGGFDVVIGNPPYVRQEWLGDIKHHLQANYQSFHGMADLYVYFYELGIKLLKPSGVLSFIVTNKWMKAGYGEPLRRFFVEHAWVESVVDFGHAKQIFPDADVFPSIVVVRKPYHRTRPKSTRLCSIPRDQLRIDDLGRQIESEGHSLPVSQLNSDGWELEPPQVSALLDKLRRTGKPLCEAIGARPLFGIKTGFNEAFLIDDETKNRLVVEDPSCERFIKPYIRGQDIKRWSNDWAMLWMIVMRSSSDITSESINSEEHAEARFKIAHPSLYKHFKQFEDKLRKRSDQGKFWWELRSCAYYDKVESPKICIQRIAYHSRIALDNSGTYVNDSTIFLTATLPWVLACLNSPAIWYLAFRTFPHKKDEALAMDIPFVEQLPIPDANDVTIANASLLVEKLCEFGSQRQHARKSLLDWLKVEYEVDNPGLKLASALELSSDEFVAEVKKRRSTKGALTSAALKGLRTEHSLSITPMQAKLNDSQRWEAELAAIVNRAYGLSSTEVELMWRTSPPRMPGKAPAID